METQLVVQNSRNYPIRIIDVHVIKFCTSPLAGTLFFAPGQAADASIGLGFDLDSGNTDASVEEHGTVSLSKPYFSGDTVSILPGKQQVFEMVAVTRLHACTFRYIFTILDGEKKTYQTIGHGSKPFAISAVLALSKYSVAYVGGTVTPDGQFMSVDPKTYKM